MRRQWWMLLILAGLIWLFTLLTPILMPFFVGMILAYLGDPIADYLELKGLPRRWAVVVVFVVLTLIMVGGGLILVPLLWQQLLQFIDAVPAILAWVQSQALPYIEQYIALDLSASFDQVRAVVTEHWRETGTIAAQVLTQVSRSGLALAFWIGNLALIPVVAFYMLLDWDPMKGAVRDLLPRRFEPIVTKLIRECNDVLGAFLRGQLLVMLGLGIVYAIGLSILGVRFGLLIGILAGLASIVPYLGVIIGVTIAELVAFFQFQAVLPLVGVAIVFMVGQILESIVFQPLLLGDKIGLHPVVVIFAVMAGGQLFGFVGVLLALPVAAVIMVVLRYGIERYKNSGLYTNQSDLHGNDRDMT
ncbi:AI-2E family transporter [Phytohalomonas tamaricis]|uniref:AI-2E family transporter n=1 Tax=Phytohalomonas tamaricis TaxID=2081032 RepID=UPI000D0B13A1|nr:AI-2E family transporter [Phytohalomonas tamaricis]